jgi:hypothetical protein
MIHYRDEKEKKYDCQKNIGHSRLLPRLFVDVNQPPAKTNVTLDYSPLNPPRPDRFGWKGQPEAAHKCPVRLSRLILCFLSHGQ